MKHGALFNGIGGFQLAAHWMGWENVFHCEIDPFCNKVVKRHFPESICYEDIKETNFSSWHGTIDILTGGFPCQPFSSSGSRRGTEDNRYLWPEMLRAIREIRPGWIVGENVRGLVNWSKGLVFDKVQSDLEIENYEILSFLLPAAGVSAPHERYRIWFIANAKEKRCGKEGTNIGRSEKRDCRIGRQWPFTNALFQDGEQIQAETGHAVVGPESIGIGQKRGYRGWDCWPVEHPVSSGNDGFSAGLAGLTTTEYRRQAIGSLGNAIVPQVALGIFKSIDVFEQTR